MDPRITYKTGFVHFCDDNEIIFEGSLRTAVSKVKERVTDLKKHHQMPNVEIFLINFLLNKLIDMRKE